MKIIVLFLKLLDNKKGSIKGIKSGEQQDNTKKTLLNITWKSLPSVLAKDDYIKIIYNDVLLRNTEKTVNMEWKRSSEPMISSKSIDYTKPPSTKEVTYLVISKGENDLKSTMKVPGSSGEGKKSGNNDGQYRKGRTKYSHKEKKVTDERINTSKNDTYSQEAMLDAIVCDHSQLKENEIAHLNKLKGKLTHQQSSWISLTKEKNARILSGLLFEWLEHLQKPLLGKDELSYIVILGNKPVMCIKKFPLELQYTLEYLLRLVYRMFPNRQDYQSLFLRRLLASLTHQTILIEGTLLPVGRDFPKLREGTLRKSLEFGASFIEELKKQMRKT